MAIKKLTPEEQAEQEYILNNEDDILSGMLEASKFTEDDDLKKEIHVKREKKELFSFVVRPLDSEEMDNITRKSKNWYPNPNGPKYPKISGELDTDKFRALVIYTATEGEPGQKIWDNPKLKDHLNEIEGLQVVKRVLMPGEQLEISNLITDMSGYGHDQEDFVKNSSEQADDSI